MIFNSIPTVLCVITAILAIGLVTTVRARVPVPFAAQITRLVSLGFVPQVVWSIVVACLVTGHLMALSLGVGKRQFGMAIAVLILAWVGTGRGLQLAITSRERRLRNQIASASLVMSAAVRAGMAPAMSLARAAMETPAPLSQQLKRVVLDYERGATLRTAMMTSANRLNLEVFTLLLTAIRVSLEYGGRLDEALDRISESICDQQRLEDKLQAATSSGRHALAMLAIFPFGFTAFFYQLNPAGFEALSSSVTGQLVIGGALLLVYLATRWGAAILDRIGI